MKTASKYQQELRDRENNRAQTNQAVSGVSGALSTINPAFGLVGGAYVGASNWLHGGDAQRQQNLLNQRNQDGDFGTQQLRNNYYDMANNLGGQVYGGGFGDYGSFNPMQTGQSPFQSLGQPQQGMNDGRQINSPYGDKMYQNQQSGQGRGGNSNQDKVGLMNRYGLSTEDMNRLDSNSYGQGGISGGGYTGEPAGSKFSQTQGMNSQQGQALSDAWYDSRLDNYQYDRRTPENQRSEQDKIQALLTGMKNPPRPGDGQDYSQILQMLGQGGLVDNGQPQQNFGSSGNPQQGLLDRFNQASQVNYNPEIDRLVGQQGQGIQNNQPLNMANLQNLQGQLGGINQNSQQGLSQLIGQLQGNNQNIQDLYGQQAGQQLNGNNPQAQAFQGLLNQGQNFAQGGQDTSGFNQFTGAVGGALQNNQGQINGVDQQTQSLIDANNQASTFQQDRAIQDLNDQLSARGLSNSQAGLEAISGANSQFARQRAGDEAKFRQDALNQAFAQRQSGNALQGQLAGQGASILSQQGQLGNADLNARIRALDTSGQLASGAGANQSRGIGDLIQLLNANQQGIGNINGLQNQQNQQNAGFAQANYGLNQQGINMGNDTLSQLMALYGQNEQRNQQIGQQGFQNAGAVYNAGNNIISNGIAGANQQFMGNQAIQGQQALQASQIGQANRAGNGQLVGAGLGLLNEFYQGYRQNNPQNGGVSGGYPNNNGGSALSTVTTRQDQYPQY